MVHVKTLLERISTIALGMTHVFSVNKICTLLVVNLLWYLRCAKLCDATREQKIVHTSSSFHSNGMQLLLEIIITCVLSERFSYDLRKIETMVTYDKTLELCNMEVRVKDMF